MAMWRHSAGQGFLFVDFNMCKYMSHAARELMSLSRGLGSNLLNGVSPADKETLDACTSHVNKPSFGHWTYLHRCLKDLYDAIPAADKVRDLLYDGRGRACSSISALGCTLN